MAALLEVRGLSKRFGGLVALEDVDLTVEAGSLHAVIGPNGSGKTTLFNVISGIYRPTAGSMRFAGRDIVGATPTRLARQGLARTFQNTRVFGSMSVLDNVVAVRHGSRSPWVFSAGERRAALDILDFTGLKDVASASAGSLPQGQRRLLELAKVLALDPKLILLDEPHGGLNNSETQRLIGMIRALCRRGLTILLIEHEMDVVMQLAQSITVLNFGKVLRAGTPAEVQGDENVVQAYLGRGTAAVAAPAPLAAPEGAPLLEVRKLAVRFGDIEAVRDVSLAVRPAEIVSVLGNNGAGKSTTLQAVCGLLPVHAGEVLLDGASILRTPTRSLVRRGVALVPERRRLFSAMTVVDNLKVGAFGKPAAYIAEAVEEVLALFPNLRRLAGSLAFSLSGGEQQMLAIGRALMSRPRLLLLDEPSLGLAPLLIEQVFAKLVEVNQRGTAILLVEQNARMALSIAHRAYVLSSGRVTIEGGGPELARDPRVQHAYLGMELARAEP